MITHTCYDFPLLVLHASDGTCPRYNGGICHPMPTPVPPYASDEEADAVRSYESAMKRGIAIAGFVRVTGATQPPAKEGRA
jgi:hypothetical protein